MADQNASRTKTETERERDPLRGMGPLEMRAVSVAVFKAHLSRDPVPVSLAGKCRGTFDVDDSIDPAVLRLDSYGTAGAQVVTVRRARLEQSHAQRAIEIGTHAEAPPRSVGELDSPTSVGGTRSTVHGHKRHPVHRNASCDVREAAGQSREGGEDDHRSGRRPFDTRHRF